MLKRLLLIFLFFLTACTTIGPAAVTPTPSPEATLTMEKSKGDVVLVPSITPMEEDTLILPTPTIPPATYYYFEPGINPLTGLPVRDPENLKRRPVMIKVSNWPREGRPHAGLTSADIVFEYYIGHQMNRFLAVYYGDNSDVIGPIRSGRLVDAQLVNLYQGLLAYGDADPQVDEVLVDALGERALAFWELPCPPMCGFATHSATGVFADSAAMTEYAVGLGMDNSTPDLRALYFQEETPVGDAGGLLLRVEYANFSIMQWQYDFEAHRYLLWMEAQVEDILDLAPMTDRNNDEPVAFDNLVVMYTEYIEYAPSLHDIVIQGVLQPQPALLFRDGILTYGTWRTPEPERPIIFETSEGAPLPFKPGKTWIVIVGMNSVTSQPRGSEWEIYFGLP